MDPILKEIISRLTQEGVVVSPESIQKHQHQGFMSTVYTADSSEGKLVLQVTRLVDEHRRNKVWNKFKGLASILDSHPEIPTSRFLLADVIDDQLAVAQTFLEGERAGQRVLRGVEIIDEWSAREEEILPEVLRVLATLHTITLDSFGWQATNVGEKVTSPTWREFIERESPAWVASLSADESLHSRLEAWVVEVTPQLSYAGPAVLVHGDAINPSNVLTRESGVALLDWEWSIGADPAWEFGDLGWAPYRSVEALAPYFDARGVSADERAAFVKRTHLYAPLWLLWGTAMHARDDDRQIYEALKTSLLQALDSH